MKSLRGKVAVVSGASRSIGRGIAVVLGELGAKVYVTGRSIRGDSTRPDLTGTTIDHTAEMVTARGGVGIAVRCDHSEEEDTAKLFARVEQEAGRLDLLVNCVWGGNERTEEFSAPFWEQPLWRWDLMYSTGVRAHYMAARYAAPLMMSNSTGLIVNTTFWDQDKNLRPAPQDFGLTAISRLSAGMADELRSHGVACVAVTPGVPRNEQFISVEELAREYEIPPVVDTSAWDENSFLWKTESTQYIGRAVASLAADPDVMEKTGRVLAVGDLSREYGFTDIDGRQLPPYQIEWTAGSSS